jgi:hypothetical protein
VEQEGEKAHLDGVNPDEVNLALVLTSDGLDSLDDLLTLRVGGLDEDVGKGKTGLSVSSEVVGRNLVEEGDGVLLSEDEERVVGDLALEVVAAFVEGLVEQSRRRSSWSTCRTRQRKR